MYLHPTASYFDFWSNWKELQSSERRANNHQLFIMKSLDFEWEKPRVFHFFQNSKLEKTKYVQVDK